MDIAELIGIIIGTINLIIIIKVFFDKKRNSNDSLYNEIESANQRIQKIKETTNGMKIYIDKHEKDIECLHSKIDNKFDKLDSKLDELKSRFEQIYGHINSINNILAEMKK